MVADSLAPNFSPKSLVSREINLRLSDLVGWARIFRCYISRKATKRDSRRKDLLVRSYQNYETFRIWYFNRAFGSSSYGEINQRQAEYVS